MQLLFLQIFERRPTNCTVTQRVVLGNVVADIVAVGRSNMVEFCKAVADIVIWPYIVSTFPTPKQVVSSVGVSCSGSVPLVHVSLTCHAPVCHRLHPFFTISSHLGQKQV